MHNETTIVGLILAVLVAGGEQSMAQTPPAGPAPGQVVDVGGHKMHIHCVGPANGSPTVILEAGGGGFSSDWSRVQIILSPDASRGSVYWCALDALTPAQGAANQQRVITMVSPSVDFIEILAPAA
jgi:hypothetical protein